MTDYTIADVKAAKARILAECPGIECSDHYDYGFRLEAWWPRGDNYWTVYQPAREENGQPLIMPTSLDAVIERLQKAKP
jgi:hypothetical protein